MKSLLPVFLVFIGLNLSAQYAIQGKVDAAYIPSLDGNVYLTKINGNEMAVALTPIKKDGSFTFHKKHISDKNMMYRLYVRRMEQAIQDTIALNQKFILSSNDELRFEKGPDLFNEYVNSNSADKEWKKLKAFQADLATQEKTIEDTLSEAYAAKLKSYTKDSLKILMVKLMGIRQLEHKGLLDSDIAENPSYYLDLLEELKESDLAVSEYLFLQRKLAYLTQEAVEAKYGWSKTINMLLGLMVIGLLVFTIRLKRLLPKVQVDLSRQEQTIQKLILEGKTNKEIANELFISISTVKTHITNIYSKLKVSSRQELLRRMHIRRGY